uniref:Uncharacterized protein n=1 Tax=Rhizophora mucronata TaxID=61149 RepID=A0A2P2NQW6_RHIMU
MQILKSIDDGDMYKQTLGRL